jgi:mono/diheme cytochrome c family protein
MGGCGNAGIAMPWFQTTLAISPERRVLFLAVICIAALLGGCAAGRQQSSPTPHATTATQAKSGETLFHNYCAGCHVVNTGARSENPPLEGSSWVTGPETRLIKILLHGVRGRMEVNGQIYNQEMPSFGPILSDADIASILSFVRKRFGELDAAITPDAVSAIRTTNPNRTSYWTVDELLANP